MKWVYLGYSRLMLSTELSNGFVINGVLVLKRMKVFSLMIKGNSSCRFLSLHWLQIYFIQMNINHGMASHNSREVFHKDGSVKLFSKTKKTVSLVFLDNNIKRYDVQNTRKAKRRRGFASFSLNTFLVFCYFIAFYIIVQKHAMLFYFLGSCHPHNTTFY